jgi:hypothetical protein
MCQYFLTLLTIFVPFLSEAPASYTFFFQYVLIFRSSSVEFFIPISMERNFLRFPH